MKKTLIALAALASVSAFAQSSVTLFGRLDASIGSTTTTTNGVKAAAANQMYNGNMTGSRWGMIGTEDLGGGLKANFKIENRFSVDTGTDTTGFTGESWVGLSGGFGEVQLGRTYTAFDGAKAVSVSSSVFDTAFTPNAVPAYTVRGDNQVKYVSPAMSGFNVVLSTAMKESTTAGAKDTNGIAAVYAAGPMKFAVGSQSDTAGKNTVFSGSYDLGVASVSAGYGTLALVNAGNESNGYNLGVNVPMGAVSFSVGYANGKTETAAGAKVSDYSGVGVGVKYALSKRSTVYAGYKDEKTKNTSGVVTTGTKLYAVGLRHDF